MRRGVATTLALLSAYYSTLIMCFESSSGVQEFSVKDNDHDGSTMIVEVNGQDVISIMTFWNFRNRAGFNYISDLKPTCEQINQTDSRVKDVIRTDFGFVSPYPFITIDGKKFLEMGVRKATIRVVCRFIHREVESVEQYDISLSPSSHYLPPPIFMKARIVTDGRLPVVIYDSSMINEPQVECKGTVLKCSSTNSTSRINWVLLPRHPGEMLGSMIALDPDTILLQAQSNMIGAAKLTKYTTFRLKYEESPTVKGFSTSAILQGTHVNYTHLHSIPISFGLTVNYTLHCMESKKGESTFLVLQPKGKPLWEGSFIGLNYLVWKCDLDAMPFPCPDAFYYLSCIDRTRTKLYLYRLTLEPLGLQYVQNGTAISLTSFLDVGLFMDLRDHRMVSNLPNFPLVAPLDWTDSVITGKAKSLTVSREFNFSVSVYLPKMDVTVVVQCFKNSSMPPPPQVQIGAGYAVYHGYKGYRSLLYLIDHANYFFDEVKGLYSSGYSPVDAVYNDNPQTRVPCKLRKVIPLERVKILLLVRETANGSTVVSLHKLDEDRRMNMRTFLSREVFSTRVQDVSAVLINQTAVRVFILHERDEALTTSDQFHVLSYFDIFLDHPIVTLMPFFPKPQGFTELISLQLTEGFKYNIKISSYVDPAGILSVSSRDTCVGYQTDADGRILVPMAAAVEARGHVARWGVHEYPTPQLFGSKPGGFSAVNILRTQHATNLPRSDCKRVIFVSERYVACITKQVLIHFLLRDEKGKMERFYTVDLQKASEITDASNPIKVDVSHIAIVEFRKMLAVIWYVKKAGKVFVWTPRIGFLQLDPPGAVFEIARKNPEIKTHGDVNDQECIDCKTKAFLSPDEQYIYYCIPEKTNLWVVRYSYPDSDGSFHPNLIHADLMSIFSLSSTSPNDLVTFDATCNDFGCLFGFYDTEGYWRFRFFVLKTTSPSETIKRTMVSQGSLAPVLSDTPRVSKMFDSDLRFQNRTLCPSLLNQLTLIGARLSFLISETEIKTVDYCFYATDWTSGIYIPDGLLKITLMKPELTFYQNPSYYLPIPGRYESFDCIGQYMLIKTKPLREVEIFRTLYVLELGSSHILQEYEIPYQLDATTQLVKANGSLLMKLFDPSTPILQEYILSPRMLQIVHPELHFPSKIVFTFHGSRDFTYPSEVKKVAFEMSRNQDKREICFSSLGELDPQKMDNSHQNQYHSKINSKHATETVVNSVMVTLKSVGLLSLGLLLPLVLMSSV